MKGLARWLPFLAAAAVLALGWSLLRFLCDDAFIAFRYVGNAYDGHGLVWNPAPFVPVEGYTSFLWVMLLWGVWALTGVEPPASANWLALAFALGTLWLVAGALSRRLPTAPAGAARTALAALALLGVASSPVFATWASSGLETAMFGFFAVGWTLAAFAGRRLAVLSALAGLALLTRPDGGLLVLATVALAAHAWALGRRSPRAAVAGLAPLLLPAAHLVWRRAYYGEWVPNTYFAKVTSAWPESGLRYLWCFLVENGGLLWLALALVWLALASARRGALRRIVGEGFGGFVAVATWLAFVGYYSTVVGGDHFGYRPFAHLVPLAGAAAAAMLVGLRWRPAVALPALAALAVAANWFGWWHEAALAGREKDGYARAEPALPSWLGPLYRDRDRHRAWLRLHYVALPRALHAETCAELRALLPERRPGQVEGLAPGERGVFRTVAAGVVGWALADVAVLDAVGLNDRVIARNPAPPAPLPFDPAVLGAAFVRYDMDRDGRLTAAELERLAAELELAARTGVVVSAGAFGQLLLALSDRDGDGLDEREFRHAADALQDTRHMAHERAPPEGYIEALRPNVVLEGGRFLVQRGVYPLYDEEIERVEREYWARVGR